MRIENPWKILKLNESKPMKIHESQWNRGSPLFYPALAGGSVQESTWRVKIDWMIMKSCETQWQSMKQGIKASGVCMNACSTGSGCVLMLLTRFWGKDDPFGRWCGCVCVFVCASVSVRICVRACMCACVRDVRSDRPSRRSTESCASGSNIHDFWDRRASNLFLRIV